ncbi:MAG: XRE family transcriptional regulator [Bauldia sp.]
MTAFVNGGLLRVGRLRLGLTQGEAAERIGVPQVSLSRYENAIQTPPDEFVARAAVVFDLPESFFRQPDQIVGAPVSVHPMWRKKSDVGARDIERIIAELNIRVLHIRRMLDALEHTPQADLPRLDPADYRGDIERIAALVRSHWLIPPGPFENLTKAVERAGVAVILSPLSGTAVSGVTVSVPGMLPIVILNRDQPADRLRWTLAHEIGHLVMHRFPVPEMEEQANEFASALLMPQAEIEAAFGPRIDMKRLAALKPEWRVSMQALLYRAESKGMIEKEKATWLWRKFSYNRWRLREPPELDFPTEQPGVIPRMVRLHLENFGFSKGEFARLLHIHEKQIAEFYDLAPAPPTGGLRLRLVQ